MCFNQWIENIIFELFRVNLVQQLQFKKKTAEM